MSRSTLVWIFSLNLLEIISCYSSQANEKYRLPNSIKPNHYNLEVTTHLEDPTNFRFTGVVNIELTVLNDTNKVIVHSKELIINETNIFIKPLNLSTDNIPITNISYDKEFDFVIIDLENALRMDAEYVLTIPFKSVLKPGLAGYYLSNYKNNNDEEEWLAVTHFEPYNARRAFPCFDEPALKATFSISLIRRKEFSAISNMPLTATTKIDGTTGWEMDTFEKSVPMSTYLVAFMVSKFKFIESSKTNANETTFKIWVRELAIDQAQHAAIIGPDVLSYFEDYFGVKFPLPKQDMVALPDFSAGAMENWGLVTYRENSLLTKIGTTSVVDQYFVANTVAHELAHQWFGNLVTMKWWTDLWLKEGFATYVANLGVNHLRPDWNVIKDATVDNHVSVFTLDALDSSHPVSVPIGHPSEIDQIFDDISYEKGSALIRMMNAFLTEDVFRKGLNEYLNKYMYKNAEQDDLWHTLTEVAHKRSSFPENFNLKTIMDSWTTQTGYPVIRIERDYDTGKTRATQKRFRLTSNSSEDVENQTWWIPLTCMKKGDNASREAKKIQWIPKTLEIEINNTINRSDWLVANVGMTGLYRINYDTNNWQLLIKALNTDGHDGVPELNRFQLLLDSMDLAWSGQLSYNIALKLMHYLKREHDYIPWRGAIIGLEDLSTIMRRSADYATFKKFARTLLTPIYKRISAIENLDDRPLNLINHAVLINQWSCDVDVPGCKENALEQFQAYVRSNFTRNPIPINYRSNAYCIAIKKGGEAEWDTMWQQYQKSNVASEKDLLLKSLSCSTDVWILTRYLERTINGESGLRHQDVSFIFDVVGTSDVGYYVARKFLFERIADLSRLELDTPAAMGSYPSVIASQITSDLELDELVKWIKSNREYFKESMLVIDQALESARIRLEWIKKNQKHVVDILNEMNNSA